MSGIGVLVFWRVGVWGSGVLRFGGAGVWGFGVLEFEVTGVLGVPLFGDFGGARIWDADVSG